MKKNWLNKERQIHNFMNNAAESLQSFPTLRDPIDGSLPGSPIPGILQARTLGWVAIAFSDVSGNNIEFYLKVKICPHPSLF